MTFTVIAFESKSSTVIILLYDDEMIDVVGFDEIVTWAKSLFTLYGEKSFNVIIPEV
jgi:hypothetical protein